MGPVLLALISKKGITIPACSVLRKVAAGTDIRGLEISDILNWIIIMNNFFVLGYSKLRGWHYENNRLNWGNELGKYNYVLPSFEWNY